MRSSSASKFLSKTAGLLAGILQQHAAATPPTVAIIPPAATADNKADSSESSRMAFLRRFSAPSHQLGDHVVTRYLAPVEVEGEHCYDGTAASRYQGSMLEALPEGVEAPEETAHFRYSGWVWFGCEAIFIKDGYFQDWMSTFGTGESPEFMPDAPEVWERDEKQVKFEAGLPPSASLAGDTYSPVDHSCADATTIAAIAAAVSPSPTTTTITSTPTTGTRNPKWNATPPNPKFFGTFDPTRYGLPQQFRSAAIPCN